MDSYKELFEKYKNGILDDALINELHKLLIRAYFTSESNMDEDEISYVEDLVIELYSNDELDEEYISEFTNKLNKDKALYKKFRLLANLHKASEINNLRKQQQILQSSEDEQEDEEELAKVLQEVISKVRSEKKEAAANKQEANLFLRITNFFKDLVPSIDFNLPQVRLAMVAISMLIVALVIWFSTDLGQKDPLSATEKLIANNYTAPSFEYGITRSTPLTDLEDAIVSAANAYNEKDYDRCLQLLKTIIEEEPIQDIEVISLINFYLGNSYLELALNHEKSELLSQSINSFNNINSSTKYYLPSRWFSVFAYLKMDKRNESIQLLDTLIQIDHFNVDKANELRKAIIGLE